MDPAVGPGSESPIALALILRPDHEAESRT